MSDPIQKLAPKQPQRRVTDRTPNRSPRAKHDTRPNFLQRLASEVMWVVQNRLHICTNLPDGLEVSKKTRMLLEQHTSVTERLKASIKVDCLEQAKKEEQLAKKK